MYVFNESKDVIGLPLESIVYVKKNCKKCQGRGYLSYLIDDGYTTIANDRTKNEERRHTPCICLNRGYVRIRKMLENQITELSAIGDESYKAEVTKDVVEKFLTNM